MALYGIAMTPAYVAWNTAANAPKTGDVANHTLRWVKNGVSSAPAASPAEVDAVNAPGIYTVALSTTETQTPIGTLCGTSSTLGVVILPITIAFERISVGSGSISWTITVEDESNRPIAGVKVWIATDSAGSNVVAGTVYTDDFGKVEVMLDAGTYYVWRDSAEYIFTNPQIIVVS